MGLVIANGIYIVNGKGRFKKLEEASFMVLNDSGTYETFYTYDNEEFDVVNE